jgi:UDP-N-acetylmuramate--alanine ligase
MRHIHLIGIGGTGLSAIARVLLERGYAVSGSDREASPLFKTITAAGAQTYLGHAAEQIAGADLVIRSSAIPDDNPEVIAAHNQNIPVLKRAEFLKELTEDKDTLAIAGSHGKTTTTAMLIWVLEALGTDPSFIAGGVVNQLGCNARSGAGLYFAIEADEYDSMFLGLAPKIAVITNIEHDHPDCFPTEEAYLAAFMAFLKRVRPDGLALICHDDPHARQLAVEMRDEPVQIMTYGTDPDATYQAGGITIDDGSPAFDLTYHNPSEGETSLGRAHLSIPGMHNLLNATAILAIIHQLGLSVEKAIPALSTFTGAGRRFEVIGQAGGVTLIDDYGHHPTEINATLEAARVRYPDHRIWAIWQPHTFSRTRMLENLFINALDQADRVAVLKVYASREESTGYSAEKIADALPDGKAVYLEDFATAKTYLTDNLQPGDLAILFSAGDAPEISRDILARLHAINKDRRENLQDG